MESNVKKIIRVVALGDLVPELPGVKLPSGLPIRLQSFLDSKLDQDKWVHVRESEKICLGNAKAIASFAKAAKPALARDPGEGALGEGRNRGGSSPPLPWTLPTKPLCGYEDGCGSTRRPIVRAS